MFFLISFASIVSCLMKILIIIGEEFRFLEGCCSGADVILVTQFVLGNWAIRYRGPSLSSVIPFSLSSSFPCKSLIQNSLKNLHNALLGSFSIQKKNGGVRTQDVLQYVSSLLKK